MSTPGSRFSIAIIGLLLAAMLPLAGGCGSYTTPGRAADFRALGISAADAEALTDAGILERMERKPLAAFPSSVAVVRVQGAGYRSRSTRGVGAGQFTVVTTRDVERDEDFQRLAEMPMLRGLAPISRLVVPERINTARDLRNIAAEVQADMLLLYTFDTVFGSESKLAPLSTFTLGLFPERQARVISTVSAALIDTRSGYIYGLAESTAQTTQLANAWTSKAAVDESRRRAERQAFEKLVGELEGLWSGVVAEYVAEVPTGGSG